MEPSEETTRLRFWRFVRGDEPARTFERWVYDEPTLEARLGAALYFELISTDFGDPSAVLSIREQLGPYVRALPGRGCYCVRLCDLDVVDMGTFHAPMPAFEQDRDWRHADVLGTFEEVRRRGQPYWWLSATRCTACGQAWLVGQEERVHDVFCLRRLDEVEVRAIDEDDRWPTDFDTYERLLEWL